MPKAKGPPYLNKPDEKYVVIVNPWGMNKRDQFNVDCLGAWLRAVFGFDPEKMQVECVYMMGTVSFSRKVI